MNKKEAIAHVCATVGLAYHSIADYSQPCDCFCHNVESVHVAYSMETLEYVRQAVIEKLERDGIVPNKGIMSEITKEDNDSK